VNAHIAKERAPASRELLVRTRSGSSAVVAADNQINANLTGIDVLL